MTNTLENNLSFAKTQDANDSLASFRNRFYMPLLNGKEVLYFCGNSLGLQPKGVKRYVDQDLKDWAEWGVEGHFNATTPWFSYHAFLREPMAKIVGANPDEVVVMNSLTTNLHLMMISFYQPDAARFKIICEGGAFPSDQYALTSQALLHGLDPHQAIVELFPEEGDTCLKTEQILQAIERHKNELALVMMGGVNYYTGQLYDIKSITEAAHRAGATAGFDLAHAAGNVALHLHDWQVDFAVWCSYKYLNGGPGGVAGAFVHRNHTGNLHLLRLAGWWGNDPEKRFTMPREFVPVASADAWQLSNAPVFPMAILRASLDLFEEAGMNRLTAKSRMLTAYMSLVIQDAVQKNACNDVVKILTPAEESWRGCQLSVRFTNHGREVHDYLTSQNVIGDWRSPDVIRFAPVPMYNSFEDVFRCGEKLNEALKHVLTGKPAIS